MKTKKATAGERKKRAKPMTMYAVASLGQDGRWSPWCETLGLTSDHAAALYRKNYPTNGEVGSRGMKNQAVKRFYMTTGHPNRTKP